ncbi:MAG: hypothetical protein P9L99_20060 [Candidatus Lernaella stagnicola]|nr:hypothetical protein [Candidatus Lernaella stagnicola]
MVLRATHLAPQLAAANTAIIRDPGDRSVARRQSESVERRRRDVLAQNTQERNAPLEKRLRNESEWAQSRPKPAKLTSNQHFKDRIPPGAIFYDEMDDLTNGVNQPGLLVSLRV